MKVELLSITSNPEKLIEIAGRTSHLSFNRQGKKSEKNFIKMLIKRGHTSVLEHAYATFNISGVSRVLTHQLVRHRLCSFTQQSQRYVSELNFKYIEPDSIKKNSKAHSLFIKFMEEARRVYSELKNLEIRNEDARFMLPNAIESQIVVSANFREWRNIIELRGNIGAQWEIRKLVIKILKQLKKNAPTAFEDFEIDQEKSTIRKIKNNFQN